MDKANKSKKCATFKLIVKPISCLIYMSGHSKYSWSIKCCIHLTWIHTFLGSLVVWVASFSLSDLHYLQIISLFVLPKFSPQKRSYIPKITTYLQQAVAKDKESPLFHQKRRLFYHCLNQNDMPVHFCPIRDMAKMNLLLHMVSSCFSDQVLQSFPHMKHHL